MGWVAPVAVPEQEIPCSRRKWPISYGSVGIVTIFADAVIILSAGILAGIAYHVWVTGAPGDVVQYTGVAAVVAALFISLMRGSGMYRPSELFILRRQIRTVCRCWGAVFLLLAAAVFALKIGQNLSRGTSLLFAATGLCALVVHRIWWRNLLTRGMDGQRFSGRKIVLITDPRSQDDSSLPKALTSLGFRLEHHFKLPPPQPGSRARAETIAQAIARVRGSEVEQIVVGADLSYWPQLRDLIAQLRILPLPVNVIPVGAISEVFRQPSREVGNAVSIEVQRAPLNPFEFTAKRALDVIMAGVGLVVLSPLLLLVAIAIKLDSPGPVFFRQRRCGFNGRTFQIVKFRTMRVQEDGETVRQAQRHDSRVTRLGRWLRRSSIDELPQLFNVLGGSMSLVGPRPHALIHDTEFDKVVSNYAFRHRVKPGVTGWAQVHGCRGPTPTPRDIERRVEYDLWYVDNWSFGLDFSILIQTLVEVLRSRNAC
ncbi:undecaprenyl-phosphate glucose phosphotransferase [Vineibacter terrae]|uniref:undecaprenyl-phosphate glucose phosphotransferase n=1 Tax=Vineibacter terrae TaxID=2586908 RepID=UPI002E363AE6|nr:undecaprenyl-phosphate glucose phosphotransferase [Vineibacter terrae]HEX2891639.1 undecaprenyl-phosphate glucose phosphotransferase [Vineibacter terrae]